MSIVEVANIKALDWQTRCVLDTESKTLRLQILPPSASRSVPSALELDSDSTLMLINTLQQSLPHLMLSALKKCSGSVPASLSMQVTKTDLEFWNTTLAERQSRMNDRGRITTFLLALIQTADNDALKDLLAFCRLKISESATEGHHQILLSKLHMALDEINQSIENEPKTGKQYEKIKHYGTHHRAAVIDLSLFNSRDSSDNE